MRPIFLLTVLLSFLGFSQITPPSELQTYYSGVDFSKTGNDLYTDLATTTIAKHTTFLDYSDRHDFLYDADADPNNTSNVVLIYSGESRPDNQWLSGLNPDSPQTYNTEHVYPRSLLDNSNAEADLHLLRVCDISVNSSRGNNPFTTGSGNYSSTGSAWYPGDDWRGDVARIIMYVNLRYNESFNDVGSLSLFLDWNAADPVSAIELNRNNHIESAQGNRNPFIDNPYLATLIWGGTTAENRWNSLSVNDYNLNQIALYPNPLRGNTLYINTKSTLSVEIFNIMGKSIINQNISSNNNTINVEYLNNGVYFIKLSNEFNTVIKKLIKK